MKAPGECEGVVVSGRRQREADDVHAGEGRVEHVVAAREERLVRGGRPRLRRPELDLVGLVPDHDVADGRQTSERVSDVRAVLVSGGLRLRRVLRVRAVAVDGQNDLHVPRVTDGVLEVSDIAVRDSSLAGGPLEREPEGVRTEAACRRDRLCTDRPGHVLAEPDEEARPVERRPRRRGTEEQAPVAATRAAHPNIT